MGQLWVGSGLKKSTQARPQRIELGGLRCGLASDLTRNIWTSWFWASGLKTLKSTRHERFKLFNNASTLNQYKCKWQDWDWKPSKLAAASSVRHLYLFIQFFIFIYSFIYLFIFVVLNLVLELKLVFPPFHAHAHPNNLATISYFLGSIIGHFLGNK